MSRLKTPTAEPLAKAPSLVARRLSGAEERHSRQRLRARLPGLGAGNRAPARACSRTPVHEALIRLQEEGLVRVLPKRGVTVLALSPDDMREVYDVIIALEGMAAELIAAMSPKDRRPIVAALEDINAEMKAALQRDELDAWARADDRFHRALIDGSGNTRLARLANTIMDQSHRARMMTLRLRAKPTKSLKEHQALIAAIKERRCRCCRAAKPKITGGARAANSCRCWTSSG